MPVVFNEQEHSYTNPEGKRYISATTLVGKFKEKFDPFKILGNGKTLIANYVSKHGHDEEYWLKKWDKTRDDACERGTAFHKAKEDYIQGRGVVVFKNSVTYVQNASLVLESTPDLWLLPDGLYTELLLWDDDWELAGQADIVCITTEGTVRYVDIDDHKTNKKIEEKSWADRAGNHRMMLPPINHVMDCNLMHYELQLSVYMYILERNGYTPRSMQFTHYGHEDELGFTPEPVVYQLTYRKKEVLAMLNQHRKDEQQRKKYSRAS